ncbi:MAG TPA: hypothetical protein VFN10_16745 [Thermoanaerobaculia bacterium]|nr:hypothetical protein [Thermoanaerobaculia bacterium]
MAYLACLSSAADVETLLLLRRSPDTFWTPTAVASAVACTTDVAAACLRALGLARLVVPASSTADAYRYSPPPDAVSQIEALAAAYRLRPNLVVQAVQCEGELRARAFAEAFRFAR